MSAFITREEIANAFKPGDHLSTFGGNPVSCAAAVVNIRFLKKEEFINDVNEKGDFIKSQLEILKNRFQLIGEVRGKGLMIGIELVRDQKKKIPANEEGKRIQDICLENGVLIGLGGVYKNVLRVQPPLVIEKEQIKEALDSLEFAFSKV